MRGQMRLRRKQKFEKNKGMSEILVVGDVEVEEKLQGIVRMLPKFKTEILGSRVSEILAREFGAETQA